MIPLRPLLSIVVEVADDQRDNTSIFVCQIPNPFITGGGGGSVLMAVWSKALPLTASCLSPLPGLKPL